MISLYCPKYERNIWRISALASKMGLIKKVRAQYSFKYKSNSAYLNRAIILGYTMTSKFLLRLPDLYLLFLHLLLIHCSFCLPLPGLFLVILLIIVYILWKPVFLFCYIFTIFYNTVIYRQDRNFTMLSRNSMVSLIM